MFPVNVSPDMAMYTLLINQGYDPIFALCEFIDNAIHAHTAKRSGRPERLLMKLSFYSNEYHDAGLKNSIVIEDNGAGISKDALQRALKPARPPASKGLSEFGIGMKSAAVWFADEWQLDTWPDREEVHLKSIFNLSKLLSEGKDTIEVEEEKAESGKHGTRISLRHLRKDLHRPGYDSICAGISEIYQRFLSGDDPQLEIFTSYNGTESRLEFANAPPEPLVSATHVKREKKTVAVGEEKTWKIKVDFKFQGHPVKGFIQLRSVGSYTSNPGLVLFRHDRVISGITQRRYIPLSLYKTSNKARAMLVYGEMDLDDSPVSFTKDKFTFEDNDFVNALITNVEGLRALLTQADNYRKNIKTVEDDTPSSQEGSQTTDYEQTGIDSASNANPEPPDGGSEALEKGARSVSAGSWTEEGSAPVVTDGKVDDRNSGANSTGAKTQGDGGSYSRMENPKPDSRIKHSSAIMSKLKTLESNKLDQLYYSLGTISLERHSALMCVAAWVFFESLARLGGANPNQSFLDYLNSKMSNDWGIPREIKKSYSVVIRHILDAGNCAKHCAVSFPIDSRQLANDFEVLEPIILKALDEAIAQSKDPHA